MTAIDNVRFLGDLIAGGRIPLKPSPILELPVAQVRTTGLCDRVEGMSKRLSVGRFWYIDSSNGVGFTSAGSLDRTSLAERPSG